MTNTAYTFAELKFLGEEDLTDYCQTLRLSCSPGTLIDGSGNYVLLSKLFKASDKNRRRLKERRIIDWTTKADTAGGQGLAAILDDGSVISFSVQKAIESYLARQSCEF